MNRVLYCIVLTRTRRGPHVYPADLRAYRIAASDRIGIDTVQTSKHVCPPWMDEWMDACRRVFTMAILMDGSSYSLVDDIHHGDPAIRKSFAFVGMVGFNSILEPFDLLLVCLLTDD